MKWRTVFDKQARKQFDDLEQKARDDLRAELKKLEADLESPGYPVTANSAPLRGNQNKGKFKVKVHDYRALDTKGRRQILVDKGQPTKDATGKVMEEGLIMVYKAGHRRDVYEE